MKDDKKQQPTYNDNPDEFLRELCEWLHTQRDIKNETISMDVMFSIFGAVDKKPHIAAVYTTSQLQYQKKPKNLLDKVKGKIKRFKQRVSDMFSTQNEDDYYDDYYD